MNTFLEDWVKLLPPTVPISSLTTDTFNKFVTATREDISLRLADTKCYDIEKLTRYVLMKYPCGEFRRKIENEFFFTIGM